MKRKLKRNHPGLILRMELVEGRSLTISKIAELLKTSRANISNVLNGNASISPNMALRIEKVFGGSAIHFLSLQIAYDLQVAKENFSSQDLELVKYK